MSGVPLVRLLSLAVTVALEELHEELARCGHDALRPVHGYALNAVLNGHDTASQVAPLLGMPKQGAAKVLQLLVDHGHVEIDDTSGEDRRAKPLVLTPRGHDAIAGSVEIQQCMEERWIELAGAQRTATTRAVLQEAVLAAGGGKLPALRLGG